MYILERIDQFGGCECARVRGPRKKGRCQNFHVGFELQADQRTDTMLMLAPRQREIRYHMGKLSFPVAYVRSIC